MIRAGDRLILMVDKATLPSAPTKLTTAPHRLALIRDSDVSVRKEAVQVPTGERCGQLAGLPPAESTGCRPSAVIGLRRLCSFEYCKSQAGVYHPMAARAAMQAPTSRALGDAKVNASHRQWPSRRKLLGPVERRWLLAHRLG
jgi:hypothetical protein